MSSGGGAGPDRVASLPRHLYVHVPLCRTKCSYCDFCSVAVTECDIPKETVALRLLRQAEAWLDRGVPAAPLRSLYVGGGTPTMLGGGLPFLVEALLARFPAEERAEVTVEANPESLDEQLVGMLRAAGVTRVSLGVQSCDDRELRALGRAHDASRALQAASHVIAAGLELSVDLMCGIPGQSERSWDASLDAVVSTGCAHVSVYPLSLEDGTPLAEAVESGDVHVPGEDAVAAMLEDAAARLGAAGLIRYEVANYARPGHESVHNTAYWTGAEYLGVGPAAAGMLSVASAAALGLGRFARTVARVRYAVAADVWEGLEPAPALDLEYLTQEQALREDTMLGMRLAEGIDESLVEASDSSDVMGELLGLGLVVQEQGRWRLTDRGWLLGNEVFERIWTKRT